MENINKNSITILHGNFDKLAFDQMKKKKIKNVFVLEGRPSMQSSKNTCKELVKRKIRPTLIADNMAGFLFYKGLAKEVLISAVVSDDDKALCSIGSMILAVLGKKHKVPVNVVLCDQEVRFMGEGNEILSFSGKRVAPKGVEGYAPLMEWVPKKYYKQRNM